MKSLKELYTVVVIPHPASRPYRFGIRKKTLKIWGGFLSFTVLLLCGFMIHYVFLAREMVELKTLRKETVFQKRQLQGFATEIMDLKKQLVRINEMDAKLRIITDIGPPSETAMVMGMGGAKLTGLSEMDMGIRSEQLARKMEEEVDALKAEALRQELSLEELTQAIKDRKLVWESTPSIWPVRGWLSSGFGKRISPFTGRLTMHNGIDIATRRGTPIIAPAAGVVSYKSSYSSLGRLIKVNHGHGIRTLYGHLAKASVRVGQKVKRGDVIGFVGNTGLSTGPHLHYEVYVNGLPINPLRYIIN